MVVGRMSGCCDRNELDSFGKPYVISVSHGVVWRFEMRGRRGNECRTESSCKCRAASDVVGVGMSVECPRRPQAARLHEVFVGGRKSWRVNNGSPAIAEVNDIRRVTEALVDEVVDSHLPCHSLLQNCCSTNHLNVPNARRLEGRTRNNYRAPVTAATVPELMLGCWRRSWIEFADGTLDDTTSVVWLQTESQMADVRISAETFEISNRTGLHDCTMGELRAIASNDASSGFTECGDPIVGDDGVRAATASWNTRGHGVNFQPVSAFPEPGLMKWNDDATVMIERAPSGAYVEEWRLVPGSRDVLSVTHDSLASTYRAGNVAVFVRDRPIPIPRPARLLDLFDEYATDRPVIEALLDCEFSVAELCDGKWTIMMSTLPWRQGDLLDV